MKFICCLGLFSAASASTFDEVKASVLVDATDRTESFGLLQNAPRHNLMVQEEGILGSPKFDGAGPALAQTDEKSESQDTIMAVATAAKKTVRDVCVHARGDKPATFSLPGDMRVSEVIFTYKSGGLTCRSGSHRSNFGCDHDSLGLVITEKDKKEVLMPLATQKVEGFERMSHKHAHWYKLQGVGEDTLQMKWKFGMQPVLGDGEYELWYNEDLTNGTVGDNAGTACYDIKVLGSPLSIENCLECTTAECQACKTCEEGYVVGLFHAKGTCVTCTEDNCATCSAQGYCKSCKEGYKLAGPVRLPRKCEANSIPAKIIENGGKCINGDFKTLKTMGSGAHTIRATVTMPSDMPKVDARQWILNLGQNGAGANHWLWSPTNVHKHGDLQFGRWNGGQIKGVSEGVTHDQMIKAASLTTTFDGKTYSFYIDGKLKKTTEITPPLDIQTNALRVGLQPAGWVTSSKKEVDFSGCVTKVEVWDSALTSVDVAKEE